MALQEIDSIEVAEGERFELSKDFHPRRFSRPVHSTALPPLSQLNLIFLSIEFQTVTELLHVGDDAQRVTFQALQGMIEVALIRLRAIEMRGFNPIINLKAGGAIC